MIIGFNAGLGKKFLITQRLVKVIKIVKMSKQIKVFHIK